MTPPLIRTSLAVAAAVATSAVAATPGIVPLPDGTTELRPARLLRSQISAAKETGAVPVLLPDRLIADGRVRAPGLSGTASGSGYAMEIDAIRGCGGANACFVAAFTARRGAPLSGATNVVLRGGVRGRFAAFTCGASCGPDRIEWRLGGVRYEIQVKGLGGRRAQMVRMANESLRAGPR